MADKVKNLIYKCRACNSEFSPNMTIPDFQLFGGSTPHNWPHECFNGRTGYGEIIAVSKPFNPENKEDKKPKKKKKVKKKEPLACNTYVYSTGVEGDYKHEKQNCWFCKRKTRAALVIGGRGFGTCVHCIKKVTTKQFKKYVCDHDSKITHEIITKDFKELRERESV